MARARTVDVGLLSEEAFVSLSIAARLLLIAGKCFADDSGVHPDSALKLKLEVFPADAYSAADVGGFLQELATAGLVERYEAAGGRWFRFVGWEADQTIKYPSYRFPLPSGAVPKAPPRTRSRDGGDQDGTGSGPGSVGDGSRTRPLGEERGGEKRGGAGRVQNDDALLALLSVLPKRDGANPRKSALRAARARLEGGAKLEELRGGAERYAAWAAARGIVGTRYVMRAVTFFGPEDHFREEWTAAAETGVRRSADFRPDSAAADYERGFDDGAGRGSGIRGTG